MQKSFETINQLEKTEYEAETSVKKEDKFWIWLLLGFLSAVISAGIWWGKNGFEKFFVAYNFKKFLNFNK